MLKCPIAETRRDIRLAFDKNLASRDIKPRYEIYVINLDAGAIGHWLSVEGGAGECP
ncbi:MAG: hypothetical protein AAGB34_03810 [Planctomycetota bacterium]